MSDWDQASAYFDLTGGGDYYAQPFEDQVSFNNQYDFEGIGDLTSSYDYLTGGNGDFWGMSSDEMGSFNDQFLSEGLGKYSSLFDGGMQDASQLFQQLTGKSFSDIDSYTQDKFIDQYLSEGIQTTLDGYSNATGKNLLDAPVEQRERLFYGDGGSGGSNTGLSSSLNALIKALIGGTNPNGEKTGLQSPLGQLAKALLATMAKRDSIKNQAKNIQTAQQLARSGSQQGLTSNRTGLPNLNTDSRDPMSYVQQAPTIQR